MTDTLFDLAEYTNRSIFLTGKAGTGKTTFLNQFVQKTKKKHIILAPTGIAAINAGGVTIHSMFGLPLRTFLPTTERIDTNLGMNIPDLMPHFRYRKDKLKLLREVEMIIIDEVSMLRADVLDMVDFSLRHIRRNPFKFGGIQMLFIGDLHQLPPVVKDEDLLKKYYQSAYFFDSLVLQDFSLITIELTQVYRQKDQDFLLLLNAIRSGNPDQIDWEKLNSRYFPNFEPDDQPYVYLTSHNRLADEINEEKLKNLPGKKYTYQAEIIGEFRESQFPTEEAIALKEGAQIMFIRNDASADKKYFNGKLATVIYLDQEEIRVKIDGSDDLYKLKKEIWENKNYTLDPDKNVEENVLGSFQQYPIRLAWAVTIHKSQGLTFDRLIIDAGKSFAYGQVYVALSRCRTLEGIILKSKITPSSIFRDYKVMDFQKETLANDRAQLILEEEKHHFAVQKFLHTLSPNWISEEIKNLKTTIFANSKLKGNLQKLDVEEMEIKLEKLISVFDKLQRLLENKLQKSKDHEEVWQEIVAKCKGAVLYFSKLIQEEIFEPFSSLYQELKLRKGVKTILADVKDFIAELEDYLIKISKLQILGHDLLEEKLTLVKATQPEKKPTHVITFQLFEDGKSIAEIAKTRNLVKGTIFTHLEKFAAQGLLEIERIVPIEKIKIFEEKFPNPAFKNLKDWKAELPDFEYQEIKILLSHYQYLEAKRQD